MSAATAATRIVALSGGVGGAKLALGLARVLPAGDLTVIANTGDDFQHLGLAISPDIDTLVYTLADLADPVQGWGRRGETWTFMNTLATLGGDTWFRLGDGDLAMHVARTLALAAGESLSAFTERVRRRLGIGSEIRPMSNDVVRTQVRTDAGWLDFQDYFVAQRCEPRVHEVRYGGIESASAAPVLEALAAPDVAAIVILPSNPMLSIEPILALPGVRDALRRRSVPVIAVSPIIGGEAVKGPTAKMLRELGLAASAEAVAERYSGLVDLFVVDTVDAEVGLPAGMERVVASTWMRSLDDREALARAVLGALGLA